MDEFIDKYLEIKTRHFALTMTLLGALNWGAFALNYNPIEIISNMLKKYIDLPNI